MSKLIDNLVDEMAEPRDDIAFVRAGIAEQEVAAPEPDSKGPDSRGPVDKYNRPFDPEIHAQKGGKPVLNKDRTIRIKAGKGKPSGRANPKYGEKHPGKGRTSIHKESTIGRSGPGMPDVDVTASYAACGVTVAEGVFIIGRAIGGDEWTPDASERSYMVDAWTKYFESKQIADIPPGLILVTALVSYAAPRFSKPVTQGRVKRAMVWLKKVGQNARARVDRGYAIRLSEQRADTPSDAQTGPM